MVKRLLKREGITLIELVIIILIMGIIAMVAIPQLHLQETRVGAAARKIVSDLRYAQDLSITKQVRHGIIFSSASYILFENDDTGNPARDPLTGSDFTVNMNGDFTGITLSTDLTGGVVKFDAIGAPLDNTGALLGAVKTITVQSSGSSSTVSIEPNTGKVTMN